MWRQEDINSSNNSIIGTSCLTGAKNKTVGAAVKQILHHGPPKNTVVWRRKKNTTNTGPLSPPPARRATAE